MRKLNLSDVFAMTRIVKDLNIKEDIKNISLDGESQAVGFDIIFMIIEKFAEKKAENSLYDFLSGPLEVSVKEIEAMDLIDLVENIEDIADFEKWQAFLKRAVR